MDTFARKLLISGDTSVSNYLLDHFIELGMTPAELVIYLQIKRASDQEVDFPSANSIAKVTGYSPQQVYNFFHEMIKKKLMTIKTIKNRQGQNCDSYDFELMYEKLANLATQNQQNTVSYSDDYQNEEPTANATTTVNQRQNVFQKIETEFGRGLSPIELETVSQWLDTDNYSPTLILLALRESVLNQVYSLKYIDRILINWRKRNIRTADDVEREVERHEGKNYQYKHPNNNNPQGPKIPMFKIK